MKMRPEAAASSEEGGKTAVRLSGASWVNYLRRIIRRSLATKNLLLWWWLERQETVKTRANLWREVTNSWGK